MPKSSTNAFWKYLDKAGRSIWDEIGPVIKDLFFSLIITVILVLITQIVTKLPINESNFGELKDSLSNLQYIFIIVAASILSVRTIGVLIIRGLGALYEEFRGLREKVRENKQMDITSEEKISEK